METKFNFNSQVCTDRNQSERLLALGLKKETSDMSIGHTGLLYPYPHREEEDRVFIPAWSLHRLIETMPKSIHLENEDWYKIIYNNSVGYQKGQFIICSSCKGNLYDNIIDCIEWLIKEGYFNKEYLV